MKFYSIALLALFSCSLSNAGHFEKLLKREYAWDAKTYKAVSKQLETLVDFQLLSLQPLLSSYKFIISSEALLSNLLQKYTKVTEKIKHCDKGAQLAFINICAEIGLSIGSLKEFFQKLNNYCKDYREHLDAAITQSRHKDLFPIAQTLMVIKFMHNKPQGKTFAANLLIKKGMSNSADQPTQQIFASKLFFDSPVGLNPSYSKTSAKLKQKHLEEKAHHIVQTFEHHISTARIRGHETLVKHEQNYLQAEQKYIRALSDLQEAFIKIVLSLKKEFFSDSTTLVNYFKQVLNALGEFKLQTALEKGLKEADELKQLMEEEQQQKSKKHVAQAPQEWAYSDTLDKETTQESETSPTASTPAVPLIGLEKKRWLISETENTACISNNFCMNIALQSIDLENVKAAQDYKHPLFVIGQSFLIYKLKPTLNTNIPTFFKYTKAVKEKRALTYNGHLSIFDYFHHNFVSKLINYTAYAHVLIVKEADDSELYQLRIPGEIHYHCITADEKRFSLKELGMFELFIAKDRAVHRCFKNISQYTPERFTPLTPPDTASLQEFVLAVKECAAKRYPQEDITSLLEQRLTLLTL